MVESKLTFLQMQIEGLFGYSPELRESHLSPSPKVFNAINVIVTIRKLIVSMLDSIVFLIAKFNDSFFKDALLFAKANDVFSKSKEDIID